MGLESHNSRRRIAATGGEESIRAVILYCDPSCILHYTNRWGRPDKLVVSHNLVVAKGSEEKTSITSLTNFEREECRKIGIKEISEGNHRLKSMYRGKFNISVDWPDFVWIWSSRKWLPISPKTKISEEVSLTEKFVLSFQLYVSEFSHRQAYIIQLIDRRRSEILGVYIKEENLCVRYKHGG